MATSSRLIALLGLLAVAGYQNRDRLGEMLGRATGQSNEGGARPGQATGAQSAGSGGGLGGLLGGLGSLLGGGGSGTNIRGGLSDLVERFSEKGKSEVANSWVQTGPNKNVDPGELEEALGDDTIEALAKQTGLSRQELLTRLQTVLPTDVDKLTPQGRLPTESEAEMWVGR